MMRRPFVSAEEYPVGKKGKKDERPNDVYQVAEISDDDLTKVVTMLAVYPERVCINTRTGEVITEAYENALFAELMRRNLIGRAYAFAQELGAQDAFTNMRVLSTSTQTLDA